MLAGTVLAVYGAIGVFVWWRGLPWPPFVWARGAPIAFATALGLTVSGAALVALARGHGRTAAGLALAVWGVAAWGALGFDPRTLFPLQLPPGETGRISLLATVAFAALGGGVLVAALRLRGHLLWTAALATLAFAPALVSLVGALIGAIVHFEWVRRAGMAHAAAIGFTVGSGALWTWAWRAASARQRTEIASLSWFTLAAVAGLGAGMIAWTSNELQMRAIERSDLSRRTSASINYVELLVTRMESTARGYALGREEWLLDGYLEFGGLLASELPTLRRLASRTAVQRERMARLDNLVQRKRAYMDEVIVSIRTGATSTSPTEFRDSRGPELSDAIRELVNEMDAEEIAAALRLTTEAEKAGVQTSAVILIAAALGSLCVVAGAIATRRARAARDQAEESLAANESRLRKAQEMARMGSWEFAVADRENEWWSEEAFRLFGLRPEARTVMKAEFFARVHPADRETVRQVIEGAIAHGGPARVDYRIVRPDGTERWLRDEIEPVRGDSGAIERVRGVMQDITETKLAQLELAGVVALQRAMIEGTVFGIVSTRPDGVITTFNRGAEKMLGYSREEMIGRQTPAVFHDFGEVTARAAELSEELGQPVLAGFEVFVARSRIHGVDERKWTYVRRDGTRFSVWLSITTLRDERGVITGFLGLATDITERERTAEMLRESRERLATIFAATDEGLVLQTNNGAVIECNDAACRILGLTRDQLMGRDSLDPRWGTIREDGSPFPGEQHPAPVALRTKQAQRGIVHGIQRPDGSRVWIRVSSVPILEPDGSVRVVVTSFTEITARLELEAELRDSEQRLRLAAEVAGLGVWYWDVAKGTDSVWDERVFALHGLRPTPDGRVQHAAWAALLLPEDLAEQEAALAVLVAQGTSIRREFRIRRADTGEQRIIESAQMAVRDRGGRVVRIVGVNRDVTAERQAAEVLRASEERFRALAARAPVGIFQTDPAGGCLYVNERWCAITGIEASQALGNGWMVALHPEDAGKVGEWWREFTESGREFNHDYRFCRPNGEVAWVSGQAIWLKDAHGKFTGCIGTVTDITERRQLLRDLERARDEALEASRLKSEFLANMSHEIRTPMNGIIGMTNLLYETALRAEQREMLQVVQSSAESLLAIINDILDFSRIEAGKLRLETREFDLRVVVEETMTLVNASAQAKRLDLQLEWDPQLARDFRGDALRIRQVLTNLLGNAVKFTDAGWVKVTVRRVPGAAGRTRVRVEVADSGCGIAQADQRKLFAAFVQVDGSSTRRHGGTGLGLAISRQLVELMGGTIGLESEAGRGSTFWFELALDPARTLGSVPPVPPRRAEETRPAADARAEEPRATTSEPARRLKLLLVEDNAGNQLVARGVLEGMGHSVTVAVHGGEALDWLARAPFDAVLMDCQMPVMDGYTATERIRRGGVLGLNPRIPIIALTAYALPSDRLRCISAGMDEYLAKPLRPEDLSAAFSRCGLLAGPEVPASPAATSSSDALDLDHVERLRALPGRAHATLLVELTEVFEQETQKSLPLLAALESTRSSSELARLMHRLAGGAANLGASTLRSIGLQLEIAARDADWNSLARLRREFEVEWERVRRALRSASGGG